MKALRTITATVLVCVLGIYILLLFARDELIDHWLEAVAAAFGLVGAWLLATHGQHAGWGWWAFLASNAAWIAFGWIRRHWFLLLQQLGFTASSLWGIWMVTGGARG